MDVIIDNEDEQQQQQQQQHAEEQEQEQEQEQIAAAKTARRAIRMKLISVLQQNEEFSFRARNKIDEQAETFLQNLGDDIHDMFCNNTRRADDEEYRGLDSGRDTEEEVETAIRFFPEVLSRRKEILYNDVRDNGEDYDVDEQYTVYEDFFYPIQLVAFTHIGFAIRLNRKAISFIPLLARLAIELGLFEEQYRGGLLCQDNRDSNILQDLMDNATVFERHYREDRDPADDKYLQVLIQLK